MWLSLVEHMLREHGVGGSNPLIPTRNTKGLRVLSQTLFSWKFSGSYLLVGMCIVFKIDEPSIVLYQNLLGLNTFPLHFVNDVLCPPLRRDNNH